MARHLIWLYTWVWSTFRDSAQPPAPQNYNSTTVSIELSAKKRTIHCVVCKYLHLVWVWNKKFVFWKCVPVSWRQSLNINRHFQFFLFLFLLFTSGNDSLRNLEHICFAGHFLPVEKNKRVADILCPSGCFYFKSHFRSTSPPSLLYPASWGAC